MNYYEIQSKILTLAECAVMENEKKPASFDINGVSFSHWNFNHGDGWLGDSWLVKTEIDAENFRGALNIFSKKMSQLIPRVSLISQSYIEYLGEPFLIHKIGSDITFFRYTETVNAVGLMFMEREKEALEILLKNKEIPDEFFYYWNDAVNSTGYSAKLLLMFSAIEALTKVNGKKDHKLVNQILGEDLANKLFAQGSGLRHRLIHGEYFDKANDKEDYLELVHGAVMNYFNKKVFLEDLINEKVVHPQRHFFGNKKEAIVFVRKKDGSNNFILKEMVENFDVNGFRNSSEYEFIYDKNLNSSY